MSLVDAAFSIRAANHVVKTRSARGTDGRLYTSIANLDPNEAQAITIEIAGGAARNPKGDILTAAEMDSHNTFDSPNAASPAPFDDFTVNDGALRFDLPAKSIVMLRIDRRAVRIGLRPNERSRPFPIGT